MGRAAGFEVPTELRERIAAGQRARWQERKEQLSALKASHARLIRALYRASVICEEHAETDALARHLLAELRSAELEVEVENISAADLIRRAYSRGSEGESEPEVATD